LASIEKADFNMQKNNSQFSAAGYVTLFLFLFLLPLNVHASKLFHTLQTSSFSSVAEAQNKYDSIVNTLEETQLDHLRIEKIGKFYSVRLGKFTDYPSAERFFNTVKPKLPNATVMKAYVKKERIVRIYSGSAPVSDTAKSGTTETADKKVTGLPVTKGREKIEDLNEKKTDINASSLPVGVKSKPHLSEKRDTKATRVPLKENLKNVEALVRKYDYAAALDVITAEITEQPEHPDLNAWYGMVLLKMDKPLEALKYLQKATELAPNAPDYHNGLGYTFFFLDRFKEAIDEFNKAIRLKPGHIDALTGLCIAYAENDNKEKAMEIYHYIKDFDKETSRQLLTIIQSNS
jgi:tetratricopeptide (TPR) repeat protein